MMYSVASKSSRTDPQKKTIIASSEMLRALDFKDLENLALHSRIATAKSDEVIWRHGADVNFVGVIGSGYIKMTHPAIKHHAYLLELFGPGQVFGFTSVVTGGHCPKSAVALTDVTYVELPKRMIVQLYEHCSALKHQLVLRLSDRMRQGSELLDTLSGGHVDQKIAAVLLMLAKNYAVHDPMGIRIEVPLTRRLISTMAGTTVESTIRVFSRWQKNDIVRTDYRCITILNEPALKELLYI